MPASWAAAILFMVGAGLAIWATERFLDGVLGLAAGLRFSAFAVGAVLSGLEAENIAVGLAAGGRGTAAVALGTVFGGTIFVLSVALGVAALLVPLEIHLPRGVLVLFAVSPLLAGLALLGTSTPRWAGALLLLAFAGAMCYLVWVSRLHQFLHSSEVHEVREVAEAQERLAARRRPLWQAFALALGSLVVLGLGGELVATGAEQLIATFGVPAFVMGMVVTPAAIELEEVARQAIPSRRGRHDVSAGNLVGTTLYFVLLNLGLIALLTPVHVDRQVVRLDWPVLLLVTWLVTLLLWHGRVGRPAGVVLLLIYAAYVVGQVIVR
jgi:cation:H+ antiporter